MLNSYFRKTKHHSFRNQHKKPNISFFPNKSRSKLKAKENLKLHKKNKQNDLTVGRKKKGGGE